MRYSPSRLKTFENCPLSFKLKYLDKIEIEQKVRFDAQFGSFIHKFLELFDGTNAVELTKLVDEFKFSPEFKEITPRTLKNAMKFYKKYSHLKSEAEKEMEIEVDDGLHMHGIIDKISYPSETSIIYTDYKTAKTANRDNHIFQMKFYNLMLSKILKLEPKDIKCMIYYPRIDIEDKFIFSNEEMKAFELVLRQKIKKVETETEFKANPGFLCKYCDYNNTKYCTVGNK